MKNKSEILIFGCRDYRIQPVKPANVQILAPVLHNLTVKTSAQNSNAKHSMASVFGFSLLLIQLHPYILLSFSGLPFLLCLSHHSVHPTSTIPGSRFTATSHLLTALSSLPFFSLGLHLFWDGETVLSDTGLIVGSSLPGFLSIKAQYVTQSLPGTQTPIRSHPILHWLKWKQRNSSGVFFKFSYTLFMKESTIQVNSFNCPVTCSTQRYQQSGDVFNWKNEG